MLIDIIAGARPNFMKVAPIIEEITKAKKKGKGISFRLIHTGQHYDKNMSDNFFTQLNIPIPDINLGAGGGTQAEQTAAIMVGYEKVLLQKPCDICLVVGDVTSTMACAIVAKKLCIMVTHVEAGIRSYDLTMPEEINRMVTDSITDYFFTTTISAGKNLGKAGIPKKRIFWVGNTMIDTLHKQRANFHAPPIWGEINLKPKKYWVLTLHRPANVDQSVNLKAIFKEIMSSNNNLPVIFPCHPRTAKIFKDLGLSFPNLYPIEPLSYLEFNYLVEHTLGVVTDSGGITEETTVMGIPCMTLRDNTERPETVSIGTNELIGTNPKNIAPAMQKINAGLWKKGEIPKLWDGKTAERIVKTLLKISKN
jgi:UDP-N-acetylglucosamine 2-epimerase (non-hydrolysing)